MSAAERGRRVVALVYATALFMTTIDITIVNVALPSIGRDLDAASSALGSVSTVYLVATAMVVGTAGWIRGRLGARVALLLPIMVFTSASALCGAAPTFATLVAARALQGIGGGLLVPVGLGLLYELYPPADRVRVTASTSLVVGLAPVLGPTVGGLLVTVLSWRAIFLVNVPVGLVIVAVGAVLMPRTSERPQRVRFDAVGFICFATGLALLVLGLSLGADERWRSVLPLVAALCGVGVLGLAVLWMRRREAPLLRFALLRSRALSVGLAVVLLSNAAFFGALYLIALYLQQTLRLSPAAAGAAMLLEAVPGLVSTQMVSRVLLTRFGTSRVATVGLVGLAAALTAMALVPRAPAAFLPLLVVLGASWSMVFIPVTLAANAEVSGTSTAHAATLLSSVRPVASSIGVALAASLLGIVVPGFGGVGAFLALAVLAVIAAGFVIAERAGGPGDGSAASPGSAT